MTNDRDLHLRIALAEGKFVTDSRERVIRWVETNFMEYVFNSWYFVDSFRFGENSRIVPDPSLPQERCNGCDGAEVVLKGSPTRVERCQECIAVEPKSLTYDEACAAINDDKTVQIQWEPYHTGFISGGFPLTEERRLIFDLAERRGYQMQIVE